MRLVIRLISHSSRQLQRIPSTGKKFPRSSTRVSVKSTPSTIISADPWTEVKDEASGLTYWWNQQTNETTHLGAPKPTLVSSSTQSPQVPAPAPQPQGGSMMSELGGMVAQGFAFGVGSSIARSAVNSLFDSGSGGDDDIVEL